MQVLLAQKQSETGLLEIHYLNLYLATLNGHPCSYEDTVADICGRASYPECAINNITALNINPAGSDELM